MARSATGKQGKKKAPKRAAAPREPGSAASPAGLEVDPDTLEFIDAIDRYRTEHSRPFPSWSEVLWILRSLGYRRG
jgi:hypothetical protein